MSKKIIVVLLFLLTFCRFSVQAVTAEEYTEGILSVLPSVAEEKIGEKIRSGDISSIVSVEYLATLAFDSFLGEMRFAAKDTCTLLSFVAFFAVLSFFKDSLGEGVWRTAEGVLLVAAAMTVYRTFSDGVEMAYSYIADAASFSNALMPITASVYLAGGNAATAVSAGAGAGAALVCVENLCADALPVLLRASVALTLIGSVGANASYGVICRGVRNAYTGVLGFFAVILTAALSFGSLVSSAADSAAARTVKYAIANAVPVVGGTVNSAYGALSASISVIKSTVGVSGVVALIIITLPVLARLILMRISLNICASGAQLIELPRISRMYSDFCAVYDLALSAVVFVFVVFVVLISAFLSFSSAIG